MFRFFFWYRNTFLVHSSHTLPNPIHIIMLCRKIKLAAQKVCVHLRGAPLPPLYRFAIVSLAVQSRRL